MVLLSGSVYLVVVTSSVIYSIFHTCRSKLLRMTIGMESSTDAGKFPDFREELDFFFKVISFGKLNVVILEDITKEKDKRGQ